jgi:hypothetical protein
MNVEVHYIVPIHFFENGKIIIISECPVYTLMLCRETSCSEGSKKIKS